MPVKCYLCPTTAPGVIKPEELNLLDFSSLLVSFKPFWKQTCAPDLCRHVDQVLPPVPKHLRSRPSPGLWESRIPKTMQTKVLLSEG